MKIYLDMTNKPAYGLCFMLGNVLRKKHARINYNAKLRRVKALLAEV